jgi:hypothetical protein
MLRPYQQQIARAVIGSIVKNKGLTFSVEIARQGGKNELSAQLEMLLLTLYIAKGGSGVKCSPTFKPQTIISMMRLKERLDDFGFAGIWTTEMGYCIKLGAARQIFLSAEESSSVVGHTADIILEIDEAQDVSKDKYTKEFRPMGSAYNTTTVLYGTTWDDSTLLEETRLVNLELEQKDGIKRHFRYDWQEIAKYNPGYGRFVESERERLGESHPLFKTQYALLPLLSGGGFLSSLQREQFQGSHSREHRPAAGSVYVAGIDLAGESEVIEEQVLTRPGRDATVITVAAVEKAGSENELSLPGIRVVEHYCWIGAKYPQLLATMVQILKTRWNCRTVCVDATGAGEPVASFLQQSLGSRVLPFKFTQSSKSELGFDLLAAINSGRLKVYRQDGSEEYRELLYELEKAKSRYRPNQTLNFFVDPTEGHDDFLMSLALVVRAANTIKPKKAKGRLNE